MNRRVLVTGSSRGIGRAIAVQLGRGGYEVVVHYRQDLTAAEETAEDVRRQGGTASVLQFDLTEGENCREAIEREITDSGPLFGTVLNAGIARDGRFADLLPTEWSEVVCANLDSFYFILQPVVRALEQARIKGRIVTISSISGLMGNQGQVNYSAAKAGIIGATRALSRELARRGITVNCVAPGLIKTDMVSDLPLEKIVQMIPMRRLGKPEEVASLVGYLLSEQAGYITGQVISVNGGMI